MSSVSSASSTVAWLNYINVQLNRYFPLPILVFGTIGLILNILIFTRRTLYNNSCIHYLLGNTVANVVVLYWVVITRMFSDGYGNDLSLTSNSFCQVRYFFTYLSRTLSTWFIVLACIDRWASSANVNRRFNTMSFARRVIVVTCVMCFASYAHVIALFGIHETSTKMTCYAPAGLYRIISDVQYLVFYALGPPVIMLSFGLATLRNLQRNRRLVVPDNNHGNGQLMKNSSRRNAQLLTMLLFQVTVTIVFIVPFAIQKLIDTFTLNIVRTSVTLAQYNLLAATLRLLSYVPHAFSFYTNTLSARIFRTELIKILNTLCQLLFKRNLILPLLSQEGVTVRTGGATLTQRPTNLREQRAKDSMNAQ